ncbi:MAG: ABC1 kinase family protein [Phycisphaerales bacterium]
MPTILRVERNIRNLRRYAEILGIFASYGLGDVVQELGLERFLERGARIATAGHANPEFAQMPRQVRIRRAMEQLGPTFIKLGQVLATRPDLIPEAWAEEFKKLQDDAPKLESGLVKLMIREELGDKVEALFDWIDDEPLGAASMAQTHAARLKTGEDVVVKVLRPSIREITEADMEAMRLIAEFAEDRFGELGYSPVEVVNQFAKELAKEVDLTMEGRATDRLRGMFEGDASVVFPKVYWEATTRALLTVERIKGVLVSKIKPEDFTAEERRAIVEAGARAQLKQCLEVGFFHADPHPGNLFALPGGRIGFIDCGMTGQLDDRTTQELAELVAGVVQGDIDQVIEVIQSLADVDLLIIESRAFRADVREFVSRFDNTPLDQLNFGLLLREFFAKVRAHKVRCPADLVLLIKALTTIESVATTLDPSFELAAFARPYVVALVKRKYSISAARKRLRGSLVKYAELAEDLPKEIRWIVGQVKKNRLAINLEHRGLQKLTETVESASRAVSLAMLVAALVVGSSIIVLASRGADGLALKVLGACGFLFAAMLAMVMVIKRK